jgi:2-methylisocitrate lyase-like PEP mutase family enzyme
MNSTTASRRAAFRQHVAARQGLLLAGAFNAMSARIIEDLGFGAIYLTGAGVTNMSLGLPDLGFIGLSDMAEHAARVRDAVDLPLVVDADSAMR